jgi:hypothetical protein
MSRTALTIPRVANADSILDEPGESEEIDDPLGQAHRLLL